VTNVYTNRFDLFVNSSSSTTAPELSEQNFQEILSACQDNRSSTIIFIPWKDFLLKIQKYPKPNSFLFLLEQTIFHYCLTIKMNPNSNSQQTWNSESGEIKHFRWHFNGDKHDE